MIYESIIKHNSSKIVLDTNGGSLSKLSCFSAILEAISPGLPKLLVSTVCCVYSDDSDTRKFIQVRFPDRGFCFSKTLKEPPFVPDTFNFPSPFSTVPLSLVFLGQPRKPGGEGLSPVFCS